MSTRLVVVETCFSCPLRNGSDQGSACRHPKEDWRRIRDEDLGRYDENGDYIDIKPSWCPLTEEAVEIRIKVVDVLALKDQ